MGVGLSAGAVSAKVAWRWRLLREGRLPLGARLATMAPGRGVGPGGVRGAVCRSLRRDAAGEEYFAVGGRRYYFEPPYEVRDREALRRGVAVVVGETVLDAEELFCEEVRPRPGDVVLDGGGHIGTSAMAFGELVRPGGVVYSFEPVMHAALRRNVECNGIAGVEVIAAGLGDRVGDEAISIEDATIDSSFARCRAAGADPGRTMAINVTTIDAFVAERGLERVDVIKLDIEGAEELAIDGAVETVERFRPKWTIASYHQDTHGDRQHEKLAARLKELGYRVREEFEGGLGVRVFAW